MINLHPYHKERCYRSSSSLSWPWLTVVLLGSLLLSIIVVYVNPIAAGLPLIAVGGIAISALILRSVRWGIYLIMFLSFTLNVFVKAIPSVPIGMAMDYCIVLMTGKFLYEGWKQDDIRKRMSTPITWAMYLWMGWHIICFFNPIAPSHIAWFYVVRPALTQIFLFFIAYHYMRTMTEVRQLLILMIALTSFCATWGVIQFINGYFPFEMDYIIANQAVHLVYIQGRWRSFGTLGSPAHFGVLMAAMTIGVLLVMRMRWSMGMHLFLWFTVTMCFFAMIWSGTRSAFVMLPLGGAIAICLSGNIRLMAICGIIGAILAVGITMPTNNYHIKRIQSSFDRENDLSYQVRKNNQEMIKPWIMAHPMGGGLGSTGVWGQRFSPGTFLATFPPDSGYIRVGVEMGWIGLSIYCALWAAIIINSFRQYLKLKDPERKAGSLMLFAVIMPLTLIESAQDIINKLPASIFWVLLAILMRITQQPRPAKERYPNPFLPKNLLSDSTESGV